MVPLSIHPHAMDAALAWCCADAQGKGDAMAAALFAADPADLTPAGCEAIAARVGCDLGRYRASLRDPATRDRVDRDLAEARAAGVRYLPTIFVGTTQLTGAGASAAELAALIAKA
jgi:protein-disulfide isomerase